MKGETVVTSLELTLYSHSLEETGEGQTDKRVCGARSLLGPHSLPGGPGWGTPLSLSGPQFPLLSSEGDRQDDLLRTQGLPKGLWGLPKH